LRGHAAFDAFCVYAYFSRTSALSDGFAAVPLSEKGGYSGHGRQFSPEGLPICKAGLPMPLKFTFTDRTSCLIEHERGNPRLPGAYMRARSCIQPKPLKLAPSITNNGSRVVAPRCGTSRENAHLYWHALALHP